MWFRFGDVVSEWILLPLETPEDQKRILSMNLTGAFVSEAIEIDFDLMVAIAGRCGRFPLAGRRRRHLVRRRARLRTCRRKARRGPTR